MTSNHRRVGGILGAAAAALTLAACTSVSTDTGSTGSTDTGDLVIASVFGNTFDPFWASLGCGAAAQAEELGVVYKEFASSSADTAAFDQSFNSATLVEPDGLLVNPTNPDQFITQYQSLMSDGVPVVTTNGTTPAAQYRIVGTDTEDLGFLDDLVDLVPDEPGTLAVIDGYPGLVPVTSRLDPVVDAILDGRSELAALETQYTGFDSTKATQAVSSLIVGNPDLRVIVVSNGPDGAATAAAVKAAGKTDEITVIALDATPAEVEALKEGSITALVAQSPKRIGAQQVQTLVDFLTSDAAGSAVEPSDEVVGTPQKLLTADNVDDPENEDWIYTADCG